MIRSNTHHRVFYAFKNTQTKEQKPTIIIMQTPQKPQFQLQQVQTSTIIHKIYTRNHIPFYFRYNHQPSVPSSPYISIPR